MARLDRHWRLSHFLVPWRDAGGESSDIDLLLIHEENKEPIERFVQVLVSVREGKEYRDLLTAGFYPEIMPLFLNLQELRKHPWILLDVLDHGRILFSKRQILEEELEKIRHRLQELGSRKVVLPDGSWYWDLKPDWQPHETFQL